MRLRLLAAAITVLASSLAAHADTFLFTTDDGSSYTFSTDGLTPDVVADFGFNHFEYQSDDTLLIFFGASDATFGNGNVDLLFAPFGQPYLLDGPQLFAGDLATDTPTFIAGTYTLSGDPNFGNHLGGTLVINGGAPDVAPSATAVTPEPSSLALLGTGLLGLAGAVRRRLA